METYSLKRNLGKVKLTKNDFIKLISLIKKDFFILNEVSESIYFSIKTDAADIKISESNLEIFLQHAELPKNLNNILIHVDSKAGNETKLIFLSLGGLSNTLHVEGTNQTWVKGKEQLLFKFIKSKSSYAWFFSEFNLAILKGIIVGLFYYNSMSIIHMYNITGFTNKIILSIISLVPIIIFFLILFKIKQVSISTQEASSIWDKDSKMTNIIAIVSLVAMVIFEVFNLLFKS